mmetsp:Transcript_65155/g.155574  ORF Transcript_65155/g.155574 Transcript_65155/m.155574 type:complete len:118 (+) Transcript_65155:127-480(+)|eukprot:CAMPEP_0178452190 /NCGR_PEP_ID=MMETSP0689_2-20121128/44103_1 /TAXON_ID=160604 /ORGANISM="Amphidinium massartii, Strain CS-259" /LENGTH=117 /DNA_ID=CAMNT_0020077861 /DNA_START=52 /DNA_END=405 /DNA_ORIENTATION=-
MGGVACCVPGKVDDYQENDNSGLRSLKGNAKEKKVRIDAEEAAATAAVAARRNGARKGTGFVKDPPAVEADEGEEASNTAPPTQALPKSDRGKGRKGTGFVHRQFLPSDLEDEEEED